MSRRGIVEVDADNVVTSFLEKPRPTETQSRLAVSGFVITPDFSSSTNITQAATTMRRLFQTLNDIERINNLVDSSTSLRYK